MSKILLPLVCLILLATTACTALDSYLLEPVLDPVTQEQLYTHPEKDGELTVTEWLESDPELNVDVLEPVWSGPREVGGLGDLVIYGIPIGGIATLAMGAYALFRRGRKKKSP